MQNKKHLRQMSNDDITKFLGKEVSSEFKAELRAERDRRDKKRAKYGKK